MGAIAGDLKYIYYKSVRTRAPLTWLHSYDSVCSHDVIRAKDTVRYLMFRPLGLHEV